MELNPIVALARIKIADKDTRRKLQDINSGLEAIKMTDKVQYGFSGITFREVGQVIK